MERILKISGEDWAKGISLQQTQMKGGIFFQASNFDPFERLGVMQPSRIAERYGNSQVTKSIKYFTPFATGGIPYFYGYADDGSATAMYQINAVTGAVTDVSSNISTASSTARGTIIFNGLPIYAKNTDIRFYNKLLIDGSGSDASIITSGITSGDHPFTIGADLNLYFPNGNSVGRVTNSTPNSTPTFVGTASVFTLESTMNIRHLVNDGRYLIIIADENTGVGNLGNFRTVVAFWDYTSGTLTQRYDFISGGLIGGVLLEDGIYIFGYDGIYVTNISTSPRVIYPFKGNTSVINYPNSVGSIIKRGNSILWGSDAKVYGYGNLITGEKKIFYQPYVFDENITALTAGGFSSSSVDVVWSGSSGNKLYACTSGTRNESFLLLSNVVFDKMYRFEYVKIVTRLPLSSGQSIDVKINSQAGGGVILNTTTKSFTNDGARQVLIYKPSPFAGSSDRSVFEELTSINIDSFKVPILSFEIWATPLDNQNQLL